VGEVVGPDGGAFVVDSSPLANRKAELKAL
jgi:hypothetical protein